MHVSWVIPSSYGTVHKFSHLVTTDISINKFYISHFWEAAEAKKLIWHKATELVYDLNYLYHLLRVSGRERESELVSFNCDKGISSPVPSYAFSPQPHNFKYKSYRLILMVMDLVQIPFITWNGQLKCIKPDSNNFSDHCYEGCSNSCDQ